MITAIVFVEVESNQIPEVAQQIADMAAVSEVYSVTGGMDLIAMVRVREFEQLADVISGSINKVPGVKQTTTHLAFRTYNEADLESGFDLGPRN